jgi:hypothetical protein
VRLLEVLDSEQDVRYTHLPACSDTEVARVIPVAVESPKADPRLDLIVELGQRVSGAWSAAFERTLTTLRDEGSFDITDIKGEIERTSRQVFTLRDVPAGDVAEWATAIKHALRAANAAAARRSQDAGTDESTARHTLKQRGFAVGEVGAG